MPGDNVEVARAIFDAIRRDDIDASLALVDPQIEFIPLASAQVEGRAYRGHEGLRRWDQERKETWKLEFQIDEFLAIGDRVLIHGAIRATGHGSGASIDTRVSWLFDFRDGKVLRVETFTDANEARAAAGAQAPATP